MQLCRSDLASQIRESLTMREATELYGFEIGRGGFITCPFHADKTASLKIYPDHGGWHCFGCNKGGSVIDFVMELFGLTFPQACVRLNNDFRLGLTAHKPTPSERSAVLESRRREKAELDAYRRDYDAHNKRYAALWEAKMDGPDNPAYPEACRELPGLEYYFDSHPWR